MTAVVRSEVAPVYGQARLASERVDEILYGWQVDILSRCGEFCQISTDYGYQGYVLATDLELASLPFFGKQMEIVGNFADILSSPHVRGDVVTTLPRGSLVTLSGDIGDYTQVRMAGNRICYTRGENLKEQAQQVDDEAKLRQALALSAKSYLGTQYRWGGKTHLGIDCSGLTFMAYRLNGITIWRDAHHKDGYPLRKIPPAVAEVGDLIYFPGHIAMILEDGKIIHSSHGNNGVKVQKLATYSQEILYACTIF